VTSLPDGWLGKTHALHVGATRARGEYLLFTDADVVFALGTVERAMRLVVSGGIQHLSVVPWITSPSRAVRWLVGAFSIFFVLFTRAWRVGDPRSTASIGIGAFNLVKSSAYWGAGGHAPIRLRPDDDLRLGRLLKQTGATSQVWSSGGTIQVDWYPTLGALIRGVEKNTFAALDYRLGAAIASGIGQLLYALAFSTPFLTTGAVRLVAIVDLAVMLAASAAAATLIGQPGVCAVLQPVALPFFAWVQARAVILTLWRGGIVWRGTFYSLAELRRHRH
jgi:hypothetical protein